MGGPPTLAGVTVPSDDLTVSGVTPAAPAPSGSAAEARPGPAAGSGPTPVATDPGDWQSEPAGGEPVTWRAVARQELITLLVVALGGGLLLGAGWALFTPVMAHWAGGAEGSAAHDVGFGLLAIVAGIITAGVLLIWPGRRPAVHATVLLVAVTVASLLGWVVGQALRGPSLRATALVVVWPLVTSAITTVRSLIAVLISPE